MLVPLHVILITKEAHLCALHLFFHFITIFNIEIWIQVLKCNVNEGPHF